MRTVSNFVKTTLAGGFFGVLPILLLYLLLSEMLEAVVALATPIADLFPAGSFALKSPVLLAIALILGASFLLGLLGRADFAARLGRVAERHTLAHLPLYQVLKRLSAQLGQRDETAFKPALLRSAEARDFAFLIEEHANGHATVLVPHAPTSLTGTLRLVPRASLEVLDDVPLADWMRVISQWGMGSRELLDRDPKR